DSHDNIPVVIISLYTVVILSHCLFTFPQDRLSCYVPQCGFYVPQWRTYIPQWRTYVPQCGT
ncbi:MAG: hypothetical protein SO468_03660, partial [Prevotella sp.]|nr:hypothetical protein [Prevotella sp.]